MNTEALFLFLILLLGLVLCSFLGGNCNKESFTGNFNGNFTVNPDDKINNSNKNSTISGTPSSSNMSSTNYDNYNHYSGSSSQLTNGATFYGKNGDSVKVNMQTDGTPALTITFTQGKQPVTLTSSPANSSGSIAKTSSNPSSSSSSAPASSSLKNNTGSLDKSSNMSFYGPNGETALIINHEGQQAIKVNTSHGSLIYTTSKPISSNENASSPFNSNYSAYNNTPSTYFGSTGVNGANTSNSNKAYNDLRSRSRSPSPSRSSKPSSSSASSSASSKPSSSSASSKPSPSSSSSASSKPSPSSSSSASYPFDSQTTRNSMFPSYDYSNSLPQGIPKSQIPRGHEDLYILKSEVVPPVCPVCPSAAMVPRQEPCPACPACARCPEPSFECKKVPNYNANNNQYLPVPVLSDFSSFGM